MPVKKKPLSTETIIAIAATITSVCALLITVYQTVLIRDQQLNSVWPYLLANTSIDEHGKATIQVTNNGVGPAIIEKVTIEYKGKPYKSMPDVIQAIAKQLGRGPFDIPWSHNEIYKGFVLPQGQFADWISANDSSDYAIFRLELPNIKAVIHYKSIYNEHWRSNYHPDNEEAVVKE
jgi:hypothetical protein